MKKVMVIILFLSLTLSYLSASNKSSSAQTKQYSYPYATAGVVVPFGLIMTYDYLDDYFDLKNVKHPTNSIKSAKKKALVLGVITGLTTITILNLSLKEVEIPVSYAYDGKTNYLMCQLNF